MKNSFVVVKRKVAGALLVMIAGVASLNPITVFAQGSEVSCICETKCIDKSINEECPVCAYDYTYCEGEDSVTEKPEEETPKEEEDYEPLTPSGNLTLVDDCGSLEMGGKQFITVVTKAGNYFYIIIDRDDKGTQTVHFLNMVDESDLLTLMDDKAVEEYLAATGENNDQTSEVTVSSEDVASKEETDVPKEPKKKNQSGILVVVLLLAAGGIGGYMFLKNKKGKKPEHTGVDPDADYNEDEGDYLDSLPDDFDEEDDEILEDYDKEESREE